MIRVSARRREILRIISVLLLALTKQAKALKQFELAPRIRASLLENYHLIEDYRTLERFNKALKIAVVESTLTHAEIKKYKILETIKRFTAKETKELEVIPEEKKESEAPYSCVVIVPKAIRAHIN